MNSAEEMLRRIANMIRPGRVQEVSHTRPPRVRVSTGDLLTAWLPWLELRAGTTVTWNPPTVGEQCVVLAPDGDLAAGIVLVGMYQDDRPSPSESPNEWVAKFPDGATIVYDHSVSHLTATGIKTGTIHASDSFTLHCPDITLDGKTTVTDLFTYQAGMRGKNGKGNNTAIQGDLTHEHGNLKSNGVVLHTHTHGGVYRGGSNTDGPNA